MDERALYETLLNEPSIKDSTRAVYVRHLEKLTHEIMVRKGRVIPLDTIIERPLDVERALSNMRPHAQDLYVASIVALLHHTGARRERPELYAEWCNLKRKIRGPIEEKYLSNAPDPRQKKAWVTFEELLSARSAADSRGDYSQDALLLWMYTAIAPVRGDYYRCVVERVTSEAAADRAVSRAREHGNNAFVLGRGRVASRTVLTDYKTSRTYGTLVTPVPADLAAAVRLSLQQSPRDHLFVDSKGLPFTSRNSFTKWANRVLRARLGNDTVSLTTLRHVFISRRDLALETKTGRERNAVARAMGHGNATQDRYNFRR